MLRRADTPADAHTTINKDEPARTHQFLAKKLPRALELAGRACPSAARAWALEIDVRACHRVAGTLGMVLPDGPSDVRAIEMAARACSFEIAVRACPGAARALEMDARGRLVPPECSEWPLEFALEQPDRSRWLLRRRLLLHRPRDCARRCFKNCCSKNICSE